MNRLRNLDLKRPELHMPVFLSDLFYDLRDRRLLPLVALIVVALVAVPFLLAGSDSEFTEVPEQVVPPAASTARDRGARLTVVETDHGLREPRRRLSHLAAKDPFVQKYTGPVGGVPEVNQTSPSATETSTSTSATTETYAGAGGAEPAAGSPPVTSPGESSPGDAGTGDSGVTVFTFAADLKIVKTVPEPDGGKSRGEPETRERVLPPATLPGKKTQVLTYMGISPDKKKPLFLVADGVTSIFGEAECVAGAESCHLLELDPGFPLTLVYGPNDVRYKFTVLKIEPVSTGHF
jgi:hypothetical protein